MITDLRQQPTGFVKRVDLCIIGGGAAGVTIAREFVGLGVQVCLVESGALEYDEPTQQLYAGTSVGQPVDLEGGRVRFLGGSTNHWGGRCAEFSAAEFAHRSWIPKSGWPLPLARLKSYYRRARTVCGFEPDWKPAADVLRMLRAPALDDFTTAATPQIWRFAPNDGGFFWNFGKVYYDAIRTAANMDLLTHANATRIETTVDASHVTALTVQSLSGVSGVISARYYALCCSGIENARLLLIGNEHAPAGIGNAKDLVGRYFMEHPRGTAATVYTSGSDATLQDLFNEFDGPDGVRYQVGLALSEAAQRDGQLLNCSADFQYNGDPEDGTTAAQDIWRNLRAGQWPGELGADVWRVLRDVRGVGENLDRQLHRRHPLLRVQSFDLVVDIEQAPDAESRVYLGTKRDAFGRREVVVDWRLSDIERATVRRFMLAVGADFARRNLGRMRLAPWIEANDGAWRGGVGETYHYIGTTRMATEPADGVVDVDCGVHGTDNLFIAGSSVFPTAGHVNPTLTIAALALRLADHLREKMAA